MMQSTNTKSKEELKIIREKICDKYGINIDDFLGLCINRFKDSKTQEIYYISNSCQCNNSNKCDVCVDFWVLENIIHDHPDCLLCDKLKKCYLAQAEYIYLYAKYNGTNEFPLQCQFSAIFGGTCKLIFTDIEPFIESAENVYKSLL